MLSVSHNGKSITVPLNSVSTSVSRYYDDVVSVPASKSNKDSIAVKPALVGSAYKAGVIYLNLDVKNLPDEMLKLMAGRKSIFDGTITITDSYGKLPTRTIKFFKASLYSFSDQYSSAYYADSIGNVAVSLSCSSLSINGVLIEQ
ncbi:hypothetical protein H7U22_22425 [Pedobacter sp. CCM 8938]|uniref:Uncharacterized protein n=2 Tax=Pedobacter fastidiosus TaxID=2765361 RepID=A0ABR7KYI4_9SPHI|nr:hypothetical protein [Pedobacter fastidiosus]